MRLALLVLALVGCGLTADRAPGEASASFPHPSDYGTATHGADALADPAGCVTCHDPGVGSGSGPACGSCHDYPHDGVRPGTVHGALWQADAPSCTGCHGDDGRRAPVDLAGATCTGCHASFPHASGYDVAHGAAVRARGGPEACASCHAVHGTSGADPGACQRCHSPTGVAGPYPHPAGFGAPSAHGALARPTCTQGCHDSGWSGLGPGCETCHDLYPHPDDFAGLGHVPVVQARSERACQACHAPGTPTAPRMPVSCGAQCHGGAP